MTSGTGELTTGILLAGDAAALPSGSGAMGDLEGRAATRSRGWGTMARLTVIFGRNWSPALSDVVETPGVRVERHFGWTGCGEE